MVKVSRVEWLLLKYCAEKNREVRSATHDMTAEAKRAVASLVEKGLVTIAAEYNNHWVNDAGRAVLETPCPEWTPPAAPELTERDLRVLASVTDEWNSCMDLGGTNGSHHSATLHKLVRAGRVEMRQSGSQKVITGADAVYPPHLFPKPKGSRFYRLARPADEEHGPI